ncbi:uncharacterized protein LOC132260207 [Phlebotomus argentipes]|uniref:uncharacterized protein LOC132260207 n=1 Tax=Phlebotomus argentipes TaxID=94469 RepID=UPI002892E3F9|nr:uncharacterized protein LOC132260207 [Phlebotomus argentipes]
MSHLLKSPIELLRLFCDAQKCSTPKYQDISHISNDANFIYSVEACGKRSTGCGFTREHAKNAAAQKLLKIIPIKQEPHEEPKKAQENAQPFFNYVGKLMEKCVKERLPKPVFGCCKDPHGFQVKCDVMRLSAVGRGSTKKEAKHAAAKEMLNILSSTAPAQPNKSGQKGSFSSSVVQQNFFLNIDPDRIEAAKKLLTEAPEGNNKKQLAQDICQLLGVPFVTYTISIDDKTVEVFELAVNMVLIQRGAAGETFEGPLKTLKDILNA